MFIKIVLTGCLFKRAAALAEGHTIEPHHLPFAREAPGLLQMAGDSYDEQVRDFKRRVIERALKESGGNKAAAARRLQVARGYLHRLIQQLRLEQRGEEVRMEEPGQDPDENQEDIA